MKLKSGFTLVEIVIVLAFVGFVAGLIVVQKSNYDAMLRDEKRKIAINTIHYALEESFYKTNFYYPEVISVQNLPIVDAELWQDPSGRTLGDPLSDYIYESANCKNAQCKEYTLKADLEKEETYIKTNF